MKHNRVDAITNILNDLEDFRIDLDQYWSDAEPQGIYDTVLTGKIDSLKAYCQTLGWFELVTNLQEMTPVRANAVESLELIQSYIVPEARRLLSNTDIEEASSPNEWFWQFVHPRVEALARQRFEKGFYGDAVEAVYKEVNSVVKSIVRDSDGRELDGAGLMTTAFSANDPIIKLTALETETDRNLQQGYMQIMAGAMTGIRNPKAHGNLSSTPRKALHLICLASLLMHKIDERL